MKNCITLEVGVACRCFVAPCRIPSTDILNRLLPDPDGPLSQSVLSSSIEAANDAYVEASAWSQSNKRGSYVKFTGVQQAQIAKCAISHGNKEAICHYTKQYCVEIRESSVSAWKGNTQLS